MTAWLRALARPWLGMPEGDKEKKEKKDKKDKKEKPERSPTKEGKEPKPVHRLPDPHRFTCFWIFWESATDHFTGFQTHLICGK